jgi:hypothetical protein
MSSEYHLIRSPCQPVRPTPQELRGRRWAPWARARKKCCTPPRILLSNSAPNAPSGQQASLGSAKDLKALLNTKKTECAAGLISGAGVRLETFRDGAAKLERAKGRLSEPGS